MVVVLQIFFALAVILLIILFVFRIRIGLPVGTALPENYRELFSDYVKFYQNLDEKEKESFEKRADHFLSAVKITGVNAVVEDIDLILIAAGAIIPVYRISDWQYINLHEILVYPGTFNADFDQSGSDRPVTGMVGHGAMQNVMIITKWELRQGFINNNDARNTAIHEFAHLIDKMDGTMDGVPEIILERKYTARWKSLMEATTWQMKNHGSDIDMYGATNHAEFFAVVSEYFFELPHKFRANHSDLYEMLARIYRTGT